MLKKTAQWVNRLLWTVMLASLVMLAVYVSVGRYYIVYVEQYQRQLVAYFVEQTGLPVSVDNLSGRWSELSPIFMMEQLRLYSPGSAVDSSDDAVLTVNDVSFQIDPLRSLLSRTIQIQRLSIAGVDCILEQTESGGWQLKAYPTDTRTTTNIDVDAVVDLLLSVKSAEFLDASFHMHYRDGDTAKLQLKELSLHQEGSFRRIKAQASFNDSKHPLLAIIEARGDPRELNKFAAKAYLKLDKIDFAEQLPAVKALGIDLADAQIDGEVWVDWQPNTVIASQGHIEIPLLDLEGLSGQQLAPIKDLTFKFRAERSSQNLQAWLPSVSARWNGQPFDFERVQLELASGVMNVAMPDLDLAKLTGQLLSVEALNAKLKGVLTTMSPQGALNNMHLQWAFNRDADRQKNKKATAKATPINTSKTTPKSKQQTAPPPLFSLRANLNNVGLSAWEGAPGASGVNGYIEALPTGGLVELDSQAMTMDFPVVYKQPLAFKSVRGQVEWQLDDGRVLVDSGPLKIITDHGPVSGLLALDLPTQQPETAPPMMALVIGLTDTSAQYRDRYIPFILNQNFLDWMSGSVPSGNVSEGGFIYRGSLAHDDPDNRSVQLYLNVEDAVLDYHPDWPKLTAISGQVLINDGDVSVTTSSAKLFDLDVSQAEVEVSHLANGALWLRVDADAQGNAADALRIVNDSYIETLVGDVFADWQLSGDAQVAVKLGIPLSEQSADKTPVMAIDVAVELADAKLLMPAYRLQVEQINGPLYYSAEQGINSDAINAQLYGKPAVVQVTTAKDKSVAVAINGRLDMQDVESWSRQAALSFFQGETDFAAQVNIIPEGKSEFTVHSNLQGVAINLPAPYTKAADAIQPFWLRLPIAKTDTQLAMALTDVMQLQLKLNAGVVESGLLILGESQDLAHEPHFFTVVGQLASFDYDLWKPVLEQYLQAAKQWPDEPLAAIAKTTDNKTSDAAEHTTSEATQSNDTEAKNTAMQVKVRNVQLDEFTGFGQVVTQSVVNLQHKASQWWLSASNQLLDGELFIPDDQSLPLVANLQRLSLPEVSMEEAGVADRSELLPEINLDLDINQLFYGGNLLGNLRFDVRSIDKGLRFENIYGSIRGVSATKDQPATLEWQQSEQGDSSHFYGQFALDDIGDVLEKWSYERIIESESGFVVMDLSWPDSPTQWQLASSEGELSVDLKDGRFLKASDTASGTLKVVGIVNFTNIIRRLQLDFSDLYESGISYDRIKGDIQLGQAELNIVRDLTVVTPSSRFEMRGSANLLTQALDMELVATLPVVNNLPWIAALAGGLPTAAGVYVASKIFQEQVDRLSSAKYSIKGDWNNPELKFERVFDDRKKAKRVKKSSVEPEKTKTEADTQQAKDLETEAIEPEAIKPEAIKPETTEVAP